MFRVWAIRRHWPIPRWSRRWWRGSRADGLRIAAAGARGYRSRRAAFPDSHDPDPSFAERCALPPLTPAKPTLGTVLRGLRARFGWTLKEMSAKSGIPMSTLSKVEHDRLTLTYDKLQQLSERLSIRMSDLFAENGEADGKVTARRSIGDIDHAFRVVTPNYDYHYLSSELRRKLMIPIITRIRARTLQEFGELVRHHGEEIVYVIEGRIEVHTEFYDPVVLERGQSIYIDSTMGHAYLAAEGCDEALVLGVCSSVEDGLMDKLMSLHDRAGL